MSEEYQDEGTAERQLLKELAGFIEKYNDHSKPFPRHLSLVVIYERSDGIVCSPMIPNSFLIQTLYSLEGATKHLRDNIVGNTQVVSQVRPLRTHSDADSAIDEAMNIIGRPVGQPPIDSMEGHQDYEETNRRYKTLIDQMNKRLGINEPLPELKDCDERTLTLETIIKLQMTTHPHWKFLMDDGKVQCVIDFMRNASNDMVRIFNMPEQPQFDFSHAEILNLIKDIEQKSSVYGL